MSDFYPEPPQSARQLAGLAGRAYPIAEEARREPEISRQLAQQKAAISNLHETINVLSSRLEAVLSVSPPTAVGKQEGKSVTTAIGNFIYENTNGVHEAQMRLQSLISRIEI